MNLQPLVVTGSALTCSLCAYTSQVPKDQQMCGNETVNCSTGYCYTATYTTADGIVHVARECANRNPAGKLPCPNAEESCKREIDQRKLKSCLAACCTTDKCNNYTPSSATGVMATKNILCLMAFVGFLFA